MRNIPGPHPGYVRSPPSEDPRTKSLHGTQCDFFFDFCFMLEFPHVSSSHDDDDDGDDDHDDDGDEFVQRLLSKPQKRLSYHKRFLEHY